MAALFDEIHIVNEIDFKINAMNWWDNFHIDVMRDECGYNPFSWVFKLMESVQLGMLPTNLRQIIAVIKTLSFLECKPREIYDWISLTRFFDGPMKLSCDYCSILNGLCEFVREKLIEDIQSDNFDIRNYETHMHSLPFINRWVLTGMLPGNLNVYGKLKKANLDKYLELSRKRCMNAKDTMNYMNFIREFMYTYELFQLIEQRWCPFKHLTQMKYDRKYYYYGTKKKDLKKAKKILIKHGKITCDNCVSILNDSKSICKNNEKSVFDDYLKLIDQILSKNLDRSYRHVSLERYDTFSNRMRIMWINILTFASITLYEIRDGKHIGEIGQAIVYFSQLSKSLLFEMVYVDPIECFNYKNVF